jgi:hypothetical protein
MSREGIDLQPADQENERAPSACSRAVVFFRIFRSSAPVAFRPHLPFRWFGWQTGCQALSFSEKSPTSTSVPLQCNLTASASRSGSLRNAPGGVETNRDSAIQIEVVGFAARDKNKVTLRTVARLCRWIENEHRVPQVWPNGFVRWSGSGADPGRHNRDAMNWDRKGGHYGHSQVPENSHWDPGYTPAEILVVTPDAVKADALLSSFPEGVHTIEVEASNGAERLHVRVSGPVGSAPVRRRAAAKPRRRRR